MIGETQLAQNLYREVLVQNPTDGWTYKRLACLLRDTHHEEQAIKYLNDYLAIAQHDHQAWQLMADIYMKTHNFQKAIYCWEEMLLANPNNFLYNLKIAECYYSIGGGDNLVLARKFFSKVIEQNDTCVRAIWGLVETCRKLESLEKKFKSDVNEDLIAMCKEKLAKIYKEHSKLDFKKIKF